MKLGLKILASALLLQGCMSAYVKSVGGDAERSYSRIFMGDYPVAWDSAVDALKTSPMETVNRENGTLQTKWIDNTAERNLIDSAGSVNLYIKAQYRFRVLLAKGVYDGSPSVRVSVQKEQQIQRDVLEGWINQPTDGIQENSLLYRIGKLIDFKTRFQEMENRKLKRELEKATGETKRGVKPKN
jgi:hypothetical protein